MPRPDIVFRGGTIIDGTGAPRVRGDVAVSGGLIAAVGDLGALAADLEIDATEQVVAPGIIDAHTHDDGLLIVNPEMTPKISQGVTTVIIGNCGFSLAPLTPTRALPQEFRYLGADEDYVYPGMADYIDRLHRVPPATNAVMLVGHSTLRVGAMDDTDRPADDREIARMRAALRDSLAAGAAGFSTGLEYAPNTRATTDEVVALAEELAPAGGLYATHIRDYVVDLDGAMEEALEIGRRARVPVVLSHHQGDGPRNYGHAPRTLARIERAAAEQPVGFDVYPYPAGAGTLLPDQVEAVERVVITWSEVRPDAAGRDLSDIAREMGVTLKEAAQRLIPGGAIYYSLDEGDVRRIVAHPKAMIGSDGLPLDRMVHPRLWGTFPRVLGHYARDLGLLTLESAVYKMTGLTAARFGLANRGRIAVGCMADLVMFDPAQIIDRATFDDPTQPSAGIDLVMVAGETVWRDGRATGARPGRPLTPYSNASRGT